MEEIPCGTIALGESLHSLSPKAPARLCGYISLLWRCSEHGSAVNLPSTSGGDVHSMAPDPSKSTSSGTIAIKVAVQIGTFAAIAFALQSVICCASLAARGYLPHGGPRARQDIRRGLHNSRLLKVTSHSVSSVAFHRLSWRPSVHQARGSH